jgi:type II secretion system protein N
MIYRGAGYLGFFVVSLGFWLYWLFPGDLAAGYLEQVFSQPNGPVLRIEKLALSVPRGVKADAVHLDTPRGGPGVTIDELVCRLDVKTLFKDVRRVTFHGNLSGGTVSGSALINRTRLEGMRLSIRLEDVRVQDLKISGAPKPFSVSGRMTGRMDTGFARGRAAGFQGDLTLADLAFEFVDPLFGVPRYQFSSAGLFLTRSKSGEPVTIERLTLTGRQLDLTASGRIFYEGTADETGLDLAVEMTLHPLFFMNAGDASPVDVARGGSGEVVLGLAVTGTLADPRVRMNGRGG